MLSESTNIIETKNVLASSKWLPSMKHFVFIGFSAQLLVQFETFTWANYLEHGKRFAEKNLRFKIAHCRFSVTCHMEIFQFQVKFFQSDEVRT